MNRSPRSFAALTLVTIGSIASPASAQCIDRIEGDTSTSDPFWSLGAAVAIDGDRILLGAPASGSQGVFSAGSAGVWIRVGGEWNLQ